MSSLPSCGCSVSGFEGKREGNVRREREEGTRVGSAIRTECFTCASV